MAVMTTAESNAVASCQTNLGDAKAAMSTARSELSDAISDMTTLMAAEAAVSPQTDATRENYNQAFLARAKFRECHGEVIRVLGMIERAHAESSIAGCILWSNFGATYIYGGGGGR